MALKPVGAPAGAEASRAAWGDAASRRLAPLYAVSLLLVFLGERVLPTMDTVRTALTGVGVAGAVAATALRLVLVARSSGDRRAVERSLALLSGVGLLALVGYFATTPTGREWLGVAAASPELRARFDGLVTVGWVVLMVVAVVPLLFGEAALAPMRGAERVEARRVRSAMSAAVTLAFAAVYAALFTYSAGELDLKADYSFFRTARPSESTRKVAASVTEPIEVTAFFPALNEVGMEVEGYLADLRRAAPQVRATVQDRLLVPALAREAKVTQDGVLVLTRGEVRETVVVGADMKTAANKLKGLDSDFQKALLKVIRKQRTAYLTVGHGELNESGGRDAAEGRTVKGLRRLLESQNYQVRDLGVAQGLASEIPADADMVLVLGPAQALFPEEVATLGRYAARGGRLFLALDPDAKVDLSALAGVVGLTWEPLLVVDDKTHYRRRYNDSDRSILATNRYSSHASISTLSRNPNAMLVIPGAAPLEKKDGADEKIDFTVRSLPNAFVDRNGDFSYDSADEKRQAHNLAAAVSKSVGPAAEGAEPLEMRAVVLSDADAVSDAALGNRANIMLIADAVRWLGGEESFSGEVSTVEDVRIEHTKEKDVVWFYGTIVGTPLLVLGAGLFAARRRRGQGGQRGRAA